MRASAGALFHVPVVAATLGDVAAAGLRLIGSSSHRGTAHTAADWSGRIAIVAGNEAAGLDEESPIDEWVRIEHRGRAESLNVAMATTVLCFEALRQRRAGGPTDGAVTERRPSDRARPAAPLEWLGAGRRAGAVRRRRRPGRRQGLDAGR